MSVTTSSSSLLFSSDGSSLSAWTLDTNSTITVSSSVGNPSPSFSLPNAGLTMRINLSSVLTSFLNKTIYFDHYVNYPTNQGCPDVIIGTNSSGLYGLNTRCDTRNNPVTLSYSAVTNSASEFSYPTGSYIASANAFTYTATWYTHKLQILTDGTVKYYINGTLYLSATVSTSSYLSSTYLVIRADGGGGPNYFDNIYIYSGIQ